MRRNLAFSLLLLVFYLLHQGFWPWDSTTIAGLPGVLVYHIAYCVFASVLMIVLVRAGWPSKLEGED